MSVMLSMYQRPPSLFGKEEFLKFSYYLPKLWNRETLNANWLLHTTVDIVHNHLRACLRNFTLLAAPLKVKRKSATAGECHMLQRFGILIDDIPDATSPDKSPSCSTSSTVTSDQSSSSISFPTKGFLLELSKRLTKLIQAIEREEGKLHENEGQWE